MRIYLLLVILFLQSCAVHKGADGSIVADLGRDAGMVMSKGADGSLYIVMDQNESKSLGKVTAAAIAKWGFDASIGLAKETTAQQGIAATKDVQLGAQAANVANTETAAKLIPKVNPEMVPVKAIGLPTSP
jgi:hypothetical protein